MGSFLLINVLKTFGGGASSAFFILYFCGVKIRFMEKEKKELLIRELCFHLPFGVVVRVYDENIEGKVAAVYPPSGEVVLGALMFKAETVRPVLRSMGSMSRDELVDMHLTVYKSDDLESNKGVLAWLYEHHYDTGGLIEAGLADRVTKDDDPYK